MNNSVYNRSGKVLQSIATMGVNVITAEYASGIYVFIPCTKWTELYLATSVCCTLLFKVWYNTCALNLRWPR